jgi:CRP-like cAMP-binding protein
MLRFSTTFRRPQPADRQRVAEVARAHRYSKGHTIFRLALSRQELADMTGTTIETRIRIMSRWGREDIVRTDTDGFTLIDAGVLATIAAS